MAYEEMMDTSILDDIKSFLQREKYGLILDLENITITAQNPSVLVTAIPLVEKMRVNRALEDISSIPEGKALVDQSRANGIPIELNTHPYARGGAHIRHSRILHGEMVDISQGIKVQGYATHGTIVSMLAHELRHAQQTQENVITGFDDKIIPPVESIWYNRFTEADAEATATDIAWKLKESGKPDAWKALKKESFAVGISAAYEKTATENPSAVSSGHAKRAAFDEWFSAHTKSGDKVADIYNAQAIRNYPNRSDLEKLAHHGKSFGGLETQQLQKLGDIDGGGVNYLDLPGGKPLDSPHYRSDMPTQKIDMHQLVMLQKEFNDIKAAHSPAASAPKAVQNTQPISKEASVKTSRFVGRADVALHLAEGNYGAAAASASMNGNLIGKTAETLSKIAPDLAKGALQLAKRAPLVGAVVTAGFVAAEVGRNLLGGKPGKAGAAFLAGSAEIAGNAVGFGVGDAARETVRGGVIAAAGEEYAAEKSGLRSMGERAVSVTSRFLEDKTEPQHRVSLPPATARSKPSAP